MRSLLWIEKKNPNLENLSSKINVDQNPPNWMQTKTTERAFELNVFMSKQDDKTKINFGNEKAIYEEIL